MSLNKRSLLQSGRFLLTKTECIMTAEEKETLRKLTEKYVSENEKNAPSWGMRAAKELKAALSCEWLLHNGFL